MRLLALEIGLRLPVAQESLGFGRVGGAGVLGFVQRRLRLDQAGALGGEVALQLDALARAVLAGMGGHEALLGQTS